MAATYQVDYPLNNYPTEWQEPVFIPSYPYPYYYMNEQNPYLMNPTLVQLSPYVPDFNKNHQNQQQHIHQHQQQHVHQHQQEHVHQHQQQYVHQPHHNSNENQKSNSDQVLPLAIRRHQPGATDPPVEQFLTRIVSQTPEVYTTVKEIPPPPVCYSAPVRKHPLPLPPSSPDSSNPDDRPIKPMKDTSVYHRPPSSGRISQPKKPLSPLKPIRSSPSYRPDSSASSVKPVQSSPVQKPYPFPLPLPPRQRSSIPNRRPVQTNIRTIFDIETPPLPPPRRRQIIVKEYINHDEEDNYPVSYVTSASRRMISYQPVPVVARREMGRYQTPPTRRMVRLEPLPVEDIIY